MKIKLRLADADRKRYDCDEFIEVDPYAVSAREAIALQAGVTIEGVPLQYDDPAEWRQTLAGVPVLENGEPVLEDVPDSDEKRPKLKGDPRAVYVLVWLALRRSGPALERLPLSDVEFDADGFSWAVVADDEDAEPGKGGQVAETTS